MRLFVGFVMQGHINIQQKQDQCLTYLILLQNDVGDDPEEDSRRYKVIGL